VTVAFKSTFTLEEIEQMLELVRQGKSMRQTGAELGGRSKNSVLSMLHRLREVTRGTSERPSSSEKISYEGRVEWEKPLARGHHPLMKWLDEEIECQRRVDPTLTLEEIVRRSGVSRRMISSWREGQMPGLGNFEAVLNVLGYTLTIKEIDDEEDADIGEARQTEEA